MRRGARGVPAGGAAVEDLDVLAQRVTASDVDLVWDMRYQPALVRAKAGGGAAGALAPPLLLARDRALRLRRTALHAGTSGHRRGARARRRRARARAGRRHAAARRGAGRGLRGLLPRRPGPAGAATGSRPRPGRSTSPRTPPRSSGSPRRRGSATSPRASTGTPRRARCVLWQRRIPPASSPATSRSRARCCRPSARLTASAIWRCCSESHRGDPPWSAWRAAYARARAVTRGATTPYQAVVALEAWLRTTRAYDEHASLPDRPDALARLGGRRHDRVLPDVRRLAGRARAPRRRAGARRRGIRPGRSARRRLPRDRSRRARLGRGVVPRLRLAAVRRHAGTRSAGPRVVVLRVVRRRGGAGARDGRRSRPRRGCSCRSRACATCSRAAPPHARGSGRAWWDSRPAFALAAVVVLLAALALLKRVLLRARPSARSGAQGAAAGACIRGRSGPRARDLP